MTMNSTNYGRAEAVKPTIHSVAFQQPAPYDLYRDTIKPLLDKFLIILAAPLVLPAITLMMILVIFQGGKPFYTQLRVGKGGKAFRMWKIRTMVPDADDRLKSYLAANPTARKEWDATQKLKNDPRITPLGHLLRKTSMDELPQLFNVLTGSMSLVGPRPIMLQQKPLYHGQTYFQLSPGITGLWQISRSRNCDFIHRAYYDETYGQTVSLITDLRILFKTVTVVMRGAGC